MSLPQHLARYVVPDDVQQTLARVREAQAAGKITSEDLLLLFEAQSNSLARSKAPPANTLRPVSDALLHAVRGMTADRATKTVYSGLLAKRWTDADVENWHYNQEVRSSTGRQNAAKRARRTTPNGRSSKVIKLRKSKQYIAPINIQLLGANKLAAGARLCLGYLATLSKNDGKRILVTYTSSIATAMGRTTRTIRNYLSALQDAGLIKVSKNHAGVSQYASTIEINDLVFSQQYEEKPDVAAYKQLRKSNDPKIQELIAPIKQFAAPAVQPNGNDQAMRKKNTAFKYNRFNNGTVGNQTAPKEEGDRGHLRPTTHSTIRLDDMRAPKYRYQPHLMGRQIGTSARKVEITLTKQLISPLYLSQRAQSMDNAAEPLTIQDRRHEPIVPSAELLKSMASKGW